MIINELLQEMNWSDIEEELTSIFARYELKTQRRYRQKAVKWYNIPVSFDIETTSTEDVKCWAYCMTMAIDDKVYIMREWSDLIKLMELIQKAGQLDYNHRIACYVHNLGFEFSYMKNIINWIDVFNIDNRRPIRAMTEYGIEWRDSAILSAESLDKVAEHLNSHKIDKRIGDLDYYKIRTSETSLTDEEYGYIINDVKILIYYIQEQLAEYEDIWRIPMTNTGRVRSYCRDHCLYVYNEDGTVKMNDNKPMRNHKYINLMRSCVLSDEIYDWLKKAFRGGFTHAASRIVGDIIPNVGSYDLTSAYPWAMVSQLYPMGSPDKFEPVSKQHMLNAMKCRACLMYIEYYGLRRKDNVPDSYISWISDKMNGDNVNYDDNGRITSADRLGMWMTEIDFSIINDVYDYEDWKYGKWCYVWFKNYLPTEFVKCILKFYKDKTELKGVEGKEIEYQKGKGMLNSTYGMCVQDPLKTGIEYADGEWIASNNVPDINDVNDKYNRFIYYPWGIWTTAYVRRRVWDAILNAGVERQCYTDTDSIKLQRYWEVKDWFVKDNNRIRDELVKAMNYHGLPIDSIEPKTSKGKIKLLGAWDYEGEYCEFRTQGAKRYIVSKAKLNRIIATDTDNVGSCLRKSYELTVAGLPKMAIDYLVSKGNPMEQFNDEMVIPASDTHKLAHRFMDNTEEMTITDYQGHTSTLLSYGGTHLSPTEFTMNMADEFYDWILYSRTLI